MLPKSGVSEAVGHQLCPHTQGDWTGCPGQGTHLLCPQSPPTTPATTDANQATNRAAGSSRGALYQLGVMAPPRCHCPSYWPLATFHLQLKSREPHQFTCSVRMSKETAGDRGEPGLTAGSPAPAQNLAEKTALWRSRGCLAQRPLQGPVRPEDRDYGAEHPPKLDTPCHLVSGSNLSRGTA